MTKNNRTEPILLFFHGYSLASAMRALEIGRQLVRRRFVVIYAGRGPHCDQLKERGFAVGDVETLPQSQMDRKVAIGDYLYYTDEWIERLVRSEREWVRRLRPAVIIGDHRPTLEITAAQEGCDVALVQAPYAQPDYPCSIPLPIGFAARSGAFQEYRYRKGLERPHYVLRLIPSIPEFHPAGSRTTQADYVGPLLYLQSTATQPSPALAAGEGWDDRRPLVWLNPGSTGDGGAFLQPLVEALSSLPVRLLVTTGGNGAIMAPGPHVRVSPFVPAQQIAAQASLYVGNGGLQSLFFCLRAGVRICGFSQHLDTEYHLQRVEALGLGVKLGWHDFKEPEKVAAVVEKMVREGCRGVGKGSALAAAIRSWDGSEKVADRIERHLRARCRQAPVSAHPLLTEEEFVAYLDAITPPSLSKKRLRALVRHNRKRGMPHRRTGWRTCYDRITSTNYLFDHEPRLFQAEYQASEDRRQRTLKFTEGRVVHRIARAVWLLDYRLKVAPMPHADYFLTIPLPVERPSYQTQVRLLATWPDDLAEHLLPSANLIYALPRENRRGEKPLELGFRCSVEVAIQSLERGLHKEELSAAQHRQYTEVDQAIGDSELYQKLRGRLRLDELETSMEKARALYGYLVTTFRFRRSAETSQSMINCVSVLLNTASEGSHCVPLARAFIAFCRLEGIPAREVVGALFGHPTGRDAFVARSFRQDLLSHTWAEFYLTEERQWVPVEMHGTAVAAQVIRDNVSDPALEDYIRAHGEQYIDFYFGNLDLARVQVSPSARSIPQVAVRSPGADAVCAPPGLHYECLLNTALIEETPL